MKNFPPELLIGAVTFLGSLLGAAFAVGVRSERTNQRLKRIELALVVIHTQLKAIQEWHTTDAEWQGAVETALEGYRERVARIERIVLATAPRMAT